MQTSRNRLEASQLEGFRPVELTGYIALPDTQKSKNQTTKNVTLPDVVAVRIRQARERKGLSFSDLHKVTGISRTALHDYESGRTKPGARELGLLCEAMRVTPNWLLLGTEDPFKERRGLKALLQLRSGPAMLAVSTLILPIAMGTFNEDELEALLTLIATILEAQDKDLYRRFSAMAEIFAEQMGSGTEAEVLAFSARAKEPGFWPHLESEVQERLKQY